MIHTYNKTLFVTYLKFKYNQHPVFYFTILNQMHQHVTHFSCCMKRKVVKTEATEKVQTHRNKKERWNDFLWEVIIKASIWDWVRNLMLWYTEMEWKGIQTWSSHPTYYHISGTVENALITEKRMETWCICYCGSIEKHVTLMVWALKCVLFSLVNI